MKTTGSRSKTVALSLAARTIWPNSEALMSFSLWAVKLPASSHRWDSWIILSRSCSVFSGNVLSLLRWPWPSRPHALVSSGLCCLPLHAAPEQPLGRPSPWQVCLYRRGQHFQAWVPSWLGIWSSEFPGAGNRGRRTGESPVLDSGGQ